MLMALCILGLYLLSLEIVDSYLVVDREMLFFDISKSIWLLAFFLLRNWQSNLPYLH